jgi:hypothetical protein
MYTLLHCSIFATASSELPFDRPFGVNAPANAGSTLFLLQGITTNFLTYNHSYPLLVRVNPAGLLSFQPYTRNLLYILSSLTSTRSSVYLVSRLVYIQTYQPLTPSAHKYNRTTMSASQSNQEPVLAATISKGMKMQELMKLDNYNAGDPKISSPRWAESKLLV